MELRRLSAEAKVGGSPEKVGAQKRAGKLLARERLGLLLDDDSFQELDLLRASRGREYGLSERRLPADGVVTGMGRIKGRSVAVFSQDFTVLGGTLGLAHAEKICKILDLAQESGSPVRSGGANSAK